MREVDEAALAACFGGSEAEEGEGHESDGEEDANDVLAFLGLDAVTGNLANDSLPHPMTSLASPVSHSAPPPLLRTMAETTRSADRELPAALCSKCAGRSSN